MIKHLAFLKEKKNGFKVNWLTVGVYEKIICWFLLS